MKRGVEYVMNETTTHVATTWMVGGGPERPQGRGRTPMGRSPAVLARTTYTSSITLALRVLPRENRDQTPPMRLRTIPIRVRVLDFLGYRETRPRGGVKRSPTNDMFDAVRETTKGVEFDVFVDEDGTITRMDSFELRRAILRGLHKVGRMPLHMEHALVVGSRAFPANGASFGPVGRTRVAAPVRRLKGPGCSLTDYEAADVNGHIAVVDRGSCEFQAQAEAAVQAGAQALVVVDTQAIDVHTRTYMSGEADVPIVCVIVSAAAGEAIDEFVASTDPSLLGRFEILGGVDAVMALDPRERPGGEGNFADGLDDVVGVEYVVEEALRSRLSVFPRHPVGFNDRWERSEMLVNQADPGAHRAVLDESYTLARAVRLDGPMHGLGARGDLTVELEVESHERGGLPPPKWAERVSKGRVDPHESDEDGNDDDDDDDDEHEHMREHAEQEEAMANAGTQPMFRRPSLAGHDVSSHGMVRVHVPTGWILAGTLESVSHARKRISVQDRATGEAKEVDAKVEITARTLMWGGVGA